MKKFLLFPFLSLFLYLPAQIVNIPDLNFKHALVTLLMLDTNADGIFDADADTNDDGEIQVSEALEVTNLDVFSESIGSLTGIESFSNLVTLICPANQITNLNLEGLNNLETIICSANPITSLDFGGLTNLKSIACGNPGLTSINLQGLTNLQTLHFGNSQLTTIDLQGLISLEVLDCYNNLLTSLDLQGLYNLNDVNCSNNQLTSLNIQGLSNLWDFNCSYNQITDIDFSGMSSIEYLNIAFNHFTSLDVSDLINLKSLNCPENQLTSLDLKELNMLNYFRCASNNITSINMKNGSLEPGLIDFSANPDLIYICCDEAQLFEIQEIASELGLNNCSINSYCSFSPGGTFYTISGENKLDLDNNGCDPDDTVSPYLKIQISDGNTSGTIISDHTGYYTIHLEDGIYSLTPDLENPAYFTIIPDMIQVDFPDAGDTLIQDFCLIPNGVHHDLEVSILPILPARPGFEATYEFIFKNKGNQVENGVLTFYFYDILMDFVEASLIPDNQGSNNLEWTFNDLLPFETRVIYLTFYCNSPSEIPPLNVNDILVFDATIQGAQVDETSDDNHCYLIQTVVGSFDPNDKTCLEGVVISENMVGDFVHYLIRFENTGTYPAENIVVKDNINTNTFDINSMQIVASSHEVWTRILNNNQVEFIFENIQLPFEDDVNDGYIAFKIKTKPDLVIGDTLKNVAAIYFDYNLPIITNEAQSIVQYVPVGTENDDWGNKEVDVFPNPTKDIIHFKTTDTISKVEIFDINGKILQSLGIYDNKLSLQDLPGGTYFLKVYALNEVYNSKVARL